MHITFDKARELLRAAVELKGADYVYQKREDGTCLYVHQEGDGSLTPGCIVGTALHLGGLSLEAMHAENYGQIGFLLESDWCGLTADPDAKMLLRVVQAHQDNGFTWGEAVRRALDS